MDEDDEFDFSDHDLDDLPANTLQQLEKTAILSTQAPATDHAHESDYGLEDGDEVINLDDEGAASVAPHHPSDQDERTHRLHDGAMDIDGPPARSQADANQLLLRIKKLEQEKARLNRDLQSEKSKNQSKSGEVEIVRRRLDALTRDNERATRAMQQSHGDALAKQKLELEKMRREREQAQTNSLFLEHEAAREADRARQIKRNARPGITSRAKPPGSPAGTPRRQKSLPMRDGFDDDDMVMASPTKNRDRAKASTPKQPGKRKREAMHQSPIPALQLSEPRQPASAQQSFDKEDSTGAQEVLAAFGHDDRRFQLLHKVVNHRSSDGGDRILEALAQYTFPSQREKKLSSTIYDELSGCSTEQDAHAIALRICNALLKIWDRCLEDQFYAPVYLILDAFQFVLAYEPSSTAVAIAERASHCIMATASLITAPMATLSRLKKSVGDVFPQSRRRTCSEIDVLNCLELLYALATSCIAIPEAIATFWRTVSLDFTVTLLQKSQPLPHLSLMLQILGTSALAATLGPISVDGQEQQLKNENIIIERLSWLLTESIEALPDPSTPDSIPEPYAPKQLWELRIQVLRLLTNLSISESGSCRVIQNLCCVGRLVHFLDSCLATLYSSPMFPTQPLTVMCINLTMRLISHLKLSHPDIDLKSKLGVIQGGHHKYLVALTRLAFSDALVLESGIDDDVVNAAHDILDEGLSLEEGEGLVGVFSSGGSS
ncbi:hypothetical protein EJ04DRAFT_514063 [Polyplosphaeria fusca]|uniref:DNA repair protein Rad26 n=1 Tax=Polyplosphaeria fusca TaxID=682080 RepID=A0A9P4QR32_9PLEO|nr:hypothetical protein EJ04DRAFT_514063 [Polyplosphaeria fusca]